MPHGGINAVDLGKRFGEIKCSIVMLNYGITELEAIYLRIKSGSIIAKEERMAAMENAKVLNVNNHCLAHAINKALKAEVESNLKAQIVSGKVMDKDVMSEFATIIKESIRTLQLYCEVHQTYQQYSQNSTSVSVNETTEKETGTKNTNTNATKRIKKKKGEHKNDPDEMSAFQKFRQLMKTICICGASGNNAASHS